MITSQLLTILPAPCYKLFEREIASIAQDFGHKKSDPLELLHENISSSHVNEFRLKAFAHLNSIKWVQMLGEVLLSDVSKLLGPDLLIQKRINLSVQMPHDPSSVLPGHSDCNSGDSPYQLNLWVPLTAAYSTNSMFVLDQARTVEYYSKVVCNELYDPEILETDFVRVSAGEALIFPPTLYHGNVLNTTSVTRVSLNVRCKSIFSPGSLTKSLDREVGAYYQVWARSPHTQWASHVMELLS
jgi:sporadic carbohydrate cluster 2OG-Fe(II) oxygenase